MSRTNEAWKTLFDRHNIPDELQRHGRFVISAGEIKKEREPRLMAKFDSRDARPAIFKQHEIGILPVQNGTYVLLKEDVYYDVNSAPGKIISHSPGELRHVVGIPWRESLRSESQALDAAFISSMLSEFTGQKTHLTIRGRLRTPEFDFCVGDTRLNVKGVQVQIDAGFESADRIYLIEAKNGEREDFIIRQLYYPFRMWNIIQDSKEIVPVFVTYSNRVFTFRSYRFREPNQYNSITLRRQRSYTLDTKKPLTSLHDILTQTYLSNLPDDIPFPQADDIHKVMDVVEAVGAGAQKKTDIIARHDYSERQGDYYPNAAAYLGFIERHTAQPGKWKLTGLGERFARQTRYDRIDLLVKQLARSPVFREALHYLNQNETPPPRSRIVEYMKTAATEGAISRVTGKTLTRRASTVLSWIEWVHRLSL